MRNDHNTMPGTAGPETMSIDTIALTIGAKVPTAIYTSSGEPVCIVDTMGERRDIAQVALRIQACWNACRGITQDELDQLNDEHPCVHPIAGELEDLKRLRQWSRQRDDQKTAMAIRNQQLVEQMRAVVLAKNDLLAAINQALDDLRGNYTAGPAVEKLRQARDKVMGE